MYARSLNFQEKCKRFFLYKRKDVKNASFKSVGMKNENLILNFSILFAFDKKTFKVFNFFFIFFIKY